MLHCHAASLFRAKVSHGLLNLLAPYFALCTFDPLPQVMHLSPLSLMLATPPLPPQNPRHMSCSSVLHGGQLGQMGPMMSVSACVLQCCKNQEQGLVISISFWVQRGMSHNPDSLQFLFPSPLSRVASATWEWRSLKTAS